MVRYRHFLATIATVAALAAVPTLGANPYTLHVLSLVGIYAIVAMGLNLVFGYAGQISLGHAAYFAVGAYTSALLTIHLEVPFAVGLFGSVTLAILLGYLVGVPSLKLEGSYLAMATIGFGEIMKMLLVNWEQVTGGPAGISRIPHPDLFTLKLMNASLKFYLVLGATTVAFVLYFNLMRSHYGTRFIAVRDSAKAAAAMGIDVKRTKVQAFVLSTAFAGLAGALYAHLNRYIAPDAFTLGESINFLIIVVVGGMGTLLGPLVGAAIIVYLRESLLILKDLNMLIYGLMLMVMVVSMPRGLVGTILLLLGRWRARRDTEDKSASMKGAKACPDHLGDRSSPLACSSHGEIAVKPRGDPSCSVMAEMLVVSDLKKNFAGLSAVSAVSFSVSEGEIVSMIGPNGAGKTSVFNMVTGFYTPDQGSIRLGAREVRGLAPHEIARLGVARTFQNLEMFGDMSVRGNMQVACQCLSPTRLSGALLRTPEIRQREAEETARLEELVDAVGLRHKLSHAASQLSYGEQRRLEIARALATGARLLLLDEPTAGMSPTEVEEILGLVVTLRGRGITIILIEHNMNLVMRVSDRIVVLDHGVKIAEGRPQEIQRDDNVRQAYLGEMVH